MAAPSLRFRSVREEDLDSLLVEAVPEKIYTKTIRLFALDFYCVIVDSGCALVKNIMTLIVRQKDLIKRDRTICFSDTFSKHRHAKRAGVIFSIDWVAWGKTGC